MQTADVLLLTNINSEWKNLEHEIGTLKYCIENGFNVPVEPLLGDDSQLQCITDTEYKYCRKTTEDLRRTKFERDFGHLLAKIDELVKDEPGEHYISQLQCHKDYEPKYCMEVQEILRRCQINSGWRNLMPEMVPIENGMNDLLELHLEDDTELKLLIDTKHIDSQVPNVFFSKLIVLKLKGMKKLEELCNGSIFLDSLNNLENLSIKECNIFQSLFKCSLNLCKLKELTLESCPTLVSVFDLTTTQSLVQLESLEISQCEKLENIFTDERRVDIDKIEEIDNGDNDKMNSCNSMFSKLKVLKIFECPLLRSIFPFLSAQDLLLPESIMIESCDKLEYIFGKHQDVQLASLNELELNDLPNFIDIFPESYDIMPLSISKAQTQLEPIKSNIFSWSHICCLRYKLRGPTSTEISLVSEGQPKDFSISLVTSSHIFMYIYLLASKNAQSH
ncbi:putative leucine-rich repeat domain, L domain-containing protein [Medicago truncatula]|nr:putative leucine-rich repeat domain, L domain-containing protein [Medicago truncatula]